MNSRNKILELIGHADGISAKVLTDRLGISKQRIHILLKELIAGGQIYKLGNPPKVFYHLKEKHNEKAYEIDEDQHALLKEKFLLVDAKGQLTIGMEAFIKWCEQRNLPIIKTLIEYEKTMQKYNTYYNDEGLIDGTPKLKNTSELNLCIDQQFYADFYAIERFGKTKLGTLLHFGKMSQSKKLISQIINMTKNKIDFIIKHMEIDACAYIPPTLKRDIQIMRELELGYNISKPIMKLEKLRGDILVPQKALSKIKDRIENAQTSILVADKRKFNNVLLIDDALGSGATINEVACKLKKYGLAKSVFGFAITGSYKGFEVLSEA